jgi:hypothetical protein
MSAASDGSSGLESTVTPDRWDRGREWLQNLLCSASPRYGPSRPGPTGKRAGNFADRILVSFRL